MWLRVILALQLRNCKTDRYGGNRLYYNKINTDNELLHHLTAVFVGKMYINLSAVVVTSVRPRLLWIGDVVC